MKGWALSGYLAQDTPTVGTAEVHGELVTFQDVVYKVHNKDILTWSNFLACEIPWRDYCQSFGTIVNQQETREQLYKFIYKKKGKKETKK